MKNERTIIYEKLSEYLNSKGAPSGVWSLLEKLYEPNGVFLKQREEIDQLSKENERLKEYLEMFWIQSNSLSMYFRSTWTTDGMKEKIGLMYDLQCEVENVLK